MVTVLNPQMSNDEFPVIQLHSVVGDMDVYQDDPVEGEHNGKWKACWVDVDQDRMDCAEIGCYDSKEAALTAAYATLEGVAEK